MEKRRRIRGVGFGSGWACGWTVALWLALALAARAPAVAQQPDIAHLAGAVEEARQLQIARPDGAGREARQPDIARLDAVIREAQQSWPVPGLAVVIVKDGRVVLEKGYGVTRVEGGQPVDENTLFAIASNTKAFTAASLAMLVEEGKVGWDDPVRKYLPYFELYDPFVSADMRIRDLLSHRSGLGTFSGDLLWYGTDYSAEEVVRRARFLPPAGPFRGSYGYSNLMFIAAGEVIEAASGVPWAEFVRTRILQPLGMDRTVTSVSALDGMENVATPHKNTMAGVIPIDWYNWDAMAAAGGIISSVADLAEWLKLQLNQGELNGRRLFSEESSWTMWTIHTPNTISAEAHRARPTTHFRGYGLGWSLADDRGRLVVSHGGGYDGMFSRVVLVPEEKLGMAILTNSMTSVATAIANTILDAYLGGEGQDWTHTMLSRYWSAREEFEARQERIRATQQEGANPPSELEAYTGRFGGPMYGDAVVEKEGDGLVLRLLPNPDLVADLTYLHHDTFLIEWRKTFAWFGIGAANFIRDTSGRVVEIKLDVPNNDLWFYELELKRKGS